jgi:hypothetical protein
VLPIAIKLNTLSVEILIGAVYLLEVLSGVLESVVKNMFAPAVAVSVTDWVVLKVPPETLAATIGATAGVAAGGGVLGVFEPPPPPPQPEKRRITTANSASFRNLIAGTSVTLPSRRISLLNPSR